MSTWRPMRTQAFESASPGWHNLFEATPESPETLVSVELLTELSG
jgi:hypothetical protein